MRALLFAATLSVLPLAAHAQEKGEWRASSKTAKAITGDLGFAGERFGINFGSYPLAQIHALKPAEALAVFNFDPMPAGTGNLFRLSIPGTTKMLHKNTLCGSEDTQWMVTFVSGRQLSVAFFSGEAMPILTAEAVGNATTLCGTFSYVR